jgi:ribosomal protein S18 acetylase RimI-like enzyme
VIRPYEARDFEDVFFLNEVCYESPCTVSELREKLSSGKCWVYDPDPAVQAVIGAVIIVPHEGTNLIWSITVAPTFRKQRIGNSLLEEAEKHYPELWLHTDPSGPAIGLYLRRGYKVIHEELNFYGPMRPAFLMVKINGQHSRSASER